MMYSCDDVQLWSGNTELWDDVQLWSGKQSCGMMYSCGQGSRAVG